jgi:hypothetical protein
MGSGFHKTNSEPVTTGESGVPPLGEVYIKSGDAFDPKLEVPVKVKPGSVRPSHRPLIQVIRKIGAKTSTSPRSWMVVACVLLGISGGIRFWRGWQIQSLQAESAACPFPLSELPRVLGSWVALEGSDAQLDPEVAKFAGSSDHVIRVYADEQSGERATALILYGLARQVSSHTPDVCYPAAGYRLVPERVDHKFSIPGLTAPVQYRSAVYTKRVGGIGKYEEASHTFFHHGQWLPDLENRWKMFRYYPGVFKVQLQRNVNTSGAAKDRNDPSESLLKELTQAITNRVSQNKMTSAQGIHTQKAGPTLRADAPRS